MEADSSVNRHGPISGVDASAKNPAREPGAVDFSRLGTARMERATGIARMQLARWVARGMPQNADGTFDLRAFVAWLRRNPSIGRPRKYQRQPGAVACRIATRVRQVVIEELARGSHAGAAGDRPERSADDAK